MLAGFGLCQDGFESGKFGGETGGFFRFSGETCRGVLYLPAQLREFFFLSGAHFTGFDESVAESFQLVRGGRGGRGRERFQFALARGEIAAEGFELFLEGGARQLVLFELALQLCKAFLCAVGGRGGLRFPFGLDRGGAAERAGHFIDRDGSGI